MYSHKEDPSYGSGQGSGSAGNEWKFTSVPLIKTIEEKCYFLQGRNKIGLYVILSLPNGTNVHAKLNQFFGAYRAYYRIRTLNYFAKKLKKLKIMKAIHYYEKLELIMSY